MKSIAQQHAEIVTALNNNRNNASQYLGKNVTITFNAADPINGYVHTVGSYSLHIRGLDNTFDASLRGQTEIRYNEIKTITIAI